MADKDQDPTALAHRLWKEIDRERIVMLGLTGDQHLQPMAAFGDEASNAVWFFTKRDTDLARDAGAAHGAMVCVQAKDQEFQASIKGEIKPDHDQARIDEYWSPFVSAWYPEGKDDPDLTLMRFEPSEARIWASSRGPLTYPMQIAKANATHQLPDIGGKADVTF